MATINFENGTKVNFDGNPTPQDVEEVASKLGITNQAQSQAPSVGGFIGNAFNSAGNFLGGIGQAVAHPIQTAQTLVGGAAGAVEGASNAVLGTQFDNQDTETWNKIVDFYKNRYGSVNNFLNTAYTDPVGFLADASMLAGGVGAGLKAAGTIGKVGEFGDIANMAYGGSKAAAVEAASRSGQLGDVAKVGQTISDVGNAINPAVMATKPLEMAGEGLQKLQGTLEKENLRLSPAQIRDNKEFLPQIVDYIGKDIKAGNPEARVVSSEANIDKIEAALSPYLKDIQVPRSTLDAALDQVPNDFQYSPFEAAASKAAVAAIKEHLDEALPGNTIAADALNEIKRSFKGSAFTKSGAMIKNEVMYRLRSVFQKTIEQQADLTTKGLIMPEDLEKMSLFKGFGIPTEKGRALSVADFNKAYAIALKAQNLLEQNVGKAQVGLMGKFTSAGIGAAAGGFTGSPLIGGIVGEQAAEQLPVTRIRSAIGKAAAKTGRIVEKAGEVAGKNKAAISATARANEATSQ